MKTTGNNLFLDSSIVIEIFAGNRSFADKLIKLPSFSISAVVLGELYVGINRVANKNKHLKKLSEFLELCDVLYIDDITAEYFGEISAALYKKGKPIPTNDIWIAATVRQYNLTLISLDKHFSEVDNIEVESW